MRSIAEAYRRSLSRLLSVCVCGIILSTSVWALDRDRTITQFHHTSWTAKEGAPEQVIAIAQTSDGYLWLGTPTGLYRFDGIQFDRYTPRSGDILDEDIFSLLATPDDGLWIGYRYGGVGFLRDGNLTNYGLAEGLPGRIRKFAKDHEGTIWGAAPSGGLVRFQGSRWQHVGQEWNYPAKTAQMVFVDEEGTVWAATEDTIMFLPKGTNSFQLTGERIGDVSQITQSHDGSIWMAETTRAVRQLRLPGIDSRSLGPEIQVGSVGILFDRDNAFWVSSFGDGVRRVPHTERFRGQKIAQFGTEAESFTEDEGLSSNHIYTVFEDREGNIWMGTTKGLDRFRESVVLPVRFLAGELAFGLAAGDGGEVWISSNKSLWVIRKHSSAPTKILDTSTGSLYRDKEGTLWIAKYVGIIALKEGGNVRIDSSPPIKNPRVILIFKDRDDRLWIYCEFEGLFHFKDGFWGRFDRQSELPKSAPIGGTIDSLGRIWLGYAGNILTVIDGDRIRTYSEEDGLRAGDIKAVYERLGRVWVAGSLGVAFFGEGRFRMLSAEGPEPFTGVSGIVGPPDGSLWLNGSRGISHIPADEVRLALENPVHEVRYRVFDSLDGLPGSAAQGRPFPNAVEGSDGRLWFSTTNGVVSVDPLQIPRNNIPPPVSIRSLTASEKLYDPVPFLNLPEGTTGLQIDFTALSLSMPERIQFKYKLDGVDAGWQEAGTRRQAFYNSLGPGHYRFRVIASNQDGVWNEEGAILEFGIAPMIYQTLWFRSLFVLLALILMIGTVMLLYRWRLAQATERLKVGFEERLAERTRIAHGLHDTLLQGFFGAAMRLQAVSNLLPAKSETAKENLDEVLDQIDVALEEGRRAIWDMHALTLEEAELGEAFSLAGEDLTKAYGADFGLTVEGEDRPLYPAVRDQIYRIGREALINAFRHAKANKIEIEIEYASKHLRVTIRDDGCGIGPDYLSAGRKGHLGLSGMREQAEKIGAELKIWSREEGGTEVELIVPRHIAFGRPAAKSLFSRLRRL